MYAGGAEVEGTGNRGGNVVEGCTQTEEGVSGERRDEFLRSFARAATG